MPAEPLTQEEVLREAPARRTRRTLDEPGRGDRLAEPELLARQVELDTAGQPIPPMEALSLPLEPDLADHQVATK